MNKELSKEENGGYDMSQSEWYTRLAWDRTCEERDELKNQVKALTAIKKGLETSLFEALAKIKLASEEKKKEAIAFAEWKDNNFFTNENILPYFRQYQVSKDYVEGDAKLFDYKDIYELFNPQK